MILLEAYSREKVRGLTSRRDLEEKLGERAETVADTHAGPIADEAALAAALATAPATARFALLGIPEDIGPRANAGRRGSDATWAPALRATLNVQSNRFLDGRSLLVLGEVQCADLQQRSEDAAGDLRQLRALVAALDERVHAVVRAVVASGRVPIVCGGGHNNAYPIIRGVAEGLHAREGVNAINLDAHSDFRACEGRHSGNGFSYAYEGGFLRRYAMLGLHESYNNEGVLQRIDDATAAGRALAFTFDDIAVRRRLSFDDACQRCFEFCGTAPCGIEVDLDAVQDLPASAVTPCGVSPAKARRFVTSACANLPAGAAYLHVTEGISRVADPTATAPNVPKFIAYLFTDFCKACLQRQSSSSSSHC